MNSAALLLTDGRVLASGGFYLDSYLASAEIYDLAGAPNGVPCTDPAECKSGLCADRICCDSPCGGDDPNDCQACNVAGSQGTCTVLPITATCRAAADVCDVAETCSGQSADCPADAVLSSTTECRASTDACDVPEMCDGQSVACPSDGYFPEGTVCRPLAGGCDVVETCTGLGIDCPADSIASAGVECRPATNACDAAERCDGPDALCPTDEFTADGASCDDNGVCQAGLCETPESGGPGGNGGTGGAGSSSSDEARRATGATAENGSCGCHTVGFHEQPSTGVIGIVALAAMTRRRRPKK